MVGWVVAGRPRGWDWGWDGGRGVVAGRPQGWDWGWGGGGGVGAGAGSRVGETLYIFRP
jgi:hypothetical protein